MSTSGVNSLAARNSDRERVRVPQIRPGTLQWRIITFAPMDKQKENYRKTADYWRKKCRRVEGDLKVQKSIANDLRTQNDRLYAERNEARSQRDSNAEALKTQHNRYELLRLDLEKVSVWFVGSFVAAIVSVIANVSQWMHR